MIKNWEEDLDARITAHLEDTLILNFDKKGFENYLRNKRYTQETIKTVLSNMGTIFKIFKRLPNFEELENYLFKKKTANMRAKYRYAYKLYKEYIQKVWNGEIY